MEILIKCALTAVVISVFCLLIKKTNPELSLLISILLSAVILIGAAGTLEMFNELISCVRDIMGVSSAVIKSLVKCIGISFLGRFSAELCRDASHSSAAAAIELSATLCAAAVSMPLIITMLKMIGTML